METKPKLTVVRLGPEAQQAVANLTYAMYTRAGDMFVAGAVSWTFHRGFTSVDDFVAQVQERVRPMYPEVDNMTVRSYLVATFKAFYGPLPTEMS